jgi:hypothetical protein
MDSNNGTLTRADNPAGGSAASVAPEARGGIASRLVSVRDVLDRRAKRRDDPGELDRTRRQDADEIRERLGYDGRLTTGLLVALEPLLVEPSPPELSSGTDDQGWATRQLLHQIRVMDEVLLRTHWRYLTHHEDGGRTARTWVLVGNRLARAKLDPRTGELVEGKAAVTLAYDGWGGLDHMPSKGTLLKSSQTSALRRLLAQIGPGRDVYENTAPPEDHQPNENGARVSATRFTPELVAVAGAGEQKAEELEVKELRAVIRRQGLFQHQIANLIRAAAGRPAITFPSEQAAREVVEKTLDDQRVVLAAEVVAPLRALLKQAKPEPPSSQGTAGRDQESRHYEPGSARAA